MNQKIKVSPSILSADFGNLAEEIKAVTNAKADLIHIDVMDGHFVPNLTIGPAVVHAIRKYSSLPFDVHLMVTNPEKFIKPFADAGADFITIHVESQNPEKTLNEIKLHGKKAGISLSPETPVSTLSSYLDKVDLVLVMTVRPGFGGQKFMADQISKIEWLSDQKKQHGFSFEISVDGGVSLENSPLLIQSGATILVAGTSVFGRNSDDYKEAIYSLKSI
jgi:ribulose-phosphate 3-epimerase